MLQWDILRTGLGGEAVLCIPGDDPSVPSRPLLGWCLFLRNLELLPCAALQGSPWATVHARTCGLLGRVAQQGWCGRDGIVRMAGQGMMAGRGWQGRGWQGKDGTSGRAEREDGVTRMAQQEQQGGMMA